MRLNARLAVASLLFAAAFLPVSPSTKGQAGTGSVIGAVEDGQGGLIPGATISLTGPSPAFTRQTVTTGSGTFVLQDIPVGTYDIKVAMPGFKVMERLAVRIDAVHRLDLGTITLDQFVKPGAHYVYSKFNGATWVSSVSQAQVDASPEWQESADGTPLSPNAAARAARAALGQVVTDANRWTVSSVTLRPLSSPARGIYEVGFLQPSRVLGGNARAVTILVLMNGEAMVPRPLEPNEPVFVIAQ